MLQWKKYSEECPPYDTLVLVRDWQKNTYKTMVNGKEEEETYEGPVKYALAFNECYRPTRSMCQVWQGKEHGEFGPIPFEIHEWAEIK